MVLRINSNVAAMRSSRHLSETDRKLAESLERLSSGFRINSAADDPAGLVISEQMRGQIVGINQAISNTELATAMVQTTEGAMTEVNNLLIRMRQLALHAANEGANDARAVEADQLEIESALDTINRISQNTQFGTRRLLDGSSGVSGEALGEGLSLVATGVETKTSPVRGYDVEVTEAPTRAALYGTTGLSEDNLEGLTVSLFEGGKTVQLTGTAEDTPLSFFGKLKERVDQQELNLRLDLDENNLLAVEHTEYGSAPTFSAASSVAGVLSPEASALTAALPGQDIQGLIGGEAAQGEGEVLRGLPGNENTQGLAVRYVGWEELQTNPDDPDGAPVPVQVHQTGTVGSVNVVNNAPAFQVGPNSGQRIRVELPETRSTALGREVKNVSGFASLADIDVTSAQGAHDALKVIDDAVDQVTGMRGRLGAFQRNTLEANLATLRVTAENLTAAESTIRDANMAKEVTEFARQSILFDAGSAMLAQANQFPRNVVELLK